MPDLQYAYRANHSTETVLLKFLVDILRAADITDLAALALLDVRRLRHGGPQNTACFVVSRNRMVLAGACTTGSSLTSVVDLSLFGVEDPHQP